MGRKEATAEKEKPTAKGPPGLRKRGGVWHIEKKVRGVKIHESTGTSSLRDAELMLARRIDEVRQALIFGVTQERTFREAAARYLEENQHLRSIRNAELMLKKLDAFIGDLPLRQVHLGTLQPFIEHRQQEGVTNRTINYALAVVRRVLNLSARLWRDENGNPWLAQAPLIRLLRDPDKRKPYPLSWTEQERLFNALPQHLQRMCLFKVNTGCREQEVCQLRWSWYIPVPEIDSAVFLIPGTMVKNGEDRLVVLNETAKAVIDEVRHIDDQFVFTYRRKPVTKILNSAFKRAREEAGLTQVRVHDLKHTFGRRLRAAGVPVETRKVLLGHRNGDITSHYSAPELEELIEAVNQVCRTKVGKSPALVILRRPGED